jgi:hypothetical protein
MLYLLPFFMRAGDQCAMVIVGKNGDNERKREDQAKHVHFVELDVQTLLGGSSMR